MKQCIRLNSFYFQIANLQSTYSPQGCTLKNLQVPPRKSQIFLSALLKKAPPFRTPQKAEKFFKRLRRF